MNKTKISTVKTTNRKTRKNIIETASDVLSVVVNDKLVTKASHKVLTTPNISNMKEYATLISITAERLTARSKSFTPSINKRLKSISNEEYTDIFGCDAENVLNKTITSTEFNIRIGDVKDVWKSKCVPATSSQARDVFMKNFKLNKPLDPLNIIVPMQSHSNCWFNTMFMCFFVSDKGRKFMRFFRQIMIEGKLLNGKLIEPPELSKAFILFNAAIEACYNNGIVRDTDWLALNTNNIIGNIYNSISEKKINHGGLSNIYQSGNPYNYYQYIMKYLDAGKNAVHMEKYEKTPDVMLFFNSKKINKRGTPDIIVIDILKPEKFTNKQIKVNYNGAIYELDSVIIRDDKKKHFCCGLRCNSVEYLFDGAAFSKLQRRPWRNLINQDYNWRMGGHINHSVWNFMNGYMMLFYYRIK